MYLDRNYIKAHRDLRYHLMNEDDRHWSQLTIEDLQPYGKFMPTIPSLLPPHADENQWTVTVGAIWISSDGTIVKIERGSHTDLASTPRIAKLIFGGPGRETPGAVVHDTGYRDHRPRMNIFTGGAWQPPRSWWDSQFYNAMCLTKTNRIKRHVYYRMVRLFGGRSWHRGNAG